MDVHLTIHNGINLNCIIEHGRHRFEGLAGFFYGLIMPARLTVQAGIFCFAKNNWLFIQ